MKYILCPASLPPDSFQDLYNQIYGTWLDLWSGTLVSLGDHRRLTSEVFTRQDYVGSLFHEEECFALCTFRWVTQNSKGYDTDSYFSLWPETALRKLFSEGPNLIVCGNFCLSPKFRTKAMGFSAKDLLMGLIVKTFLASEANCLSGAVRNNKHMNEVSYRWGAIPLATDLSSGFGDAKVDLIGFYREACLSAGVPELQAEVDRLWNEKQIIPRRPIIIHQDIQTSFQKPIRAA